MKWILLILINIIFMPLCLTAETIGVKDSKEVPAQSVYIASKTDEKITIDGKLDEEIWAKTPSVKFVDIIEGSDAFYRTEGKILWDDEYFYVGFYFEEPDVRGYWGMDDAHLPDDFSLNKRTDSWGRSESQIMTIDRFGKVFIDPDGDGSNYLEFQINTLNNVYDAWYKQGFSDDKKWNRPRFDHVEWKSPGLLSATHIYGSINNPSDIDKGWSLEIAIPWSSLKPFIRGNCPPKDGDLWGAHLGRVFRYGTGGEDIYWVWPFTELKTCHMPDRYGKLVFKDELLKFERFFAWSEKQGDEDFIGKAVGIGATDLIFTGKVTPEVVRACEKYNINIYKKVTIIAGRDQGLWNEKYQDKPMPVQELSDEEKAVSEFLSGAKYQEGTGTPENWQVTETQKKLLEELGKANVKLERGYQWGGEPDGKHFGGMNKENLLGYKLLCFHHQEVKEFIKSVIAIKLSEPGVKGIGFDFVGYGNYKCCHCAQSFKLFKEYCSRNGLKAEDAAMNKFSLETLVEFQNEMVDYVKSIKPDAITTNHVYPVFLPEPLYGNRLKIDYCGQTAAWYFYWDPLKIYNYSKVISGESNKYFPNVKGVTFIGYYNSSKLNMFPYKSPERVEIELRSMLRGGSTMLMSGIDDFIDNPVIAEKIGKFCKKYNHSKTQ